MKAVRCLLFLFVSFVWMCEARAEYKFITGDPFQSQRQLLEDIRSGRLDPTNLGGHAIEATTKDSIFAATPAKVAQLGDLLQICLPFGSKYPASRALVFRTVHQNGCGDWVIMVEIQPEIVSGIVLIPTKLLPGQTDTCGAPAILPPVPPGGDNFLLPIDFRCRKRDETASKDVEMGDMKTACDLFPAMCKNGR